MKNSKNTEADKKLKISVYRKKRRPRNAENQQKFFLIRKYSLVKDLFTRKLLKSNQLGTSILSGIANRQNCFKIQLSVCTDYNFEQYFQASLLKSQNDLESFIIT